MSLFKQKFTAQYKTKVFAAINLFFITGLIPDAFLFDVICFLVSNLPYYNTMN